MATKSVYRSIDIVNSVSKSISTNQLVTPKDRLLLATSGGQDSICLLVVLNQLTFQMDLHLSLLWCHHLWQIDSFSLMREMAKISFLFQMESCFVITPKPVHSELLARNWRYGCSHRVSLFYNYEKISLAHSASDRVETILLNLMRGTGTTGLSPLHGTKTISENSLKKKKHISQFPHFSFFCWSSIFIPQQEVKKNVGMKFIDRAHSVNNVFLIDATLAEHSVLLVKPIGCKGADSKDKACNDLSWSLRVESMNKSSAFSYTLREAKGTDSKDIACSHSEQNRVSTVNSLSSSATASSSSEGLAQLVQLMLSAAVSTLSTVVLTPLTKIYPVQSAALSLLSAKLIAKTSIARTKHARRADFPCTVGAHTLISIACQLIAKEGTVDCKACNSLRSCGAQLQDKLWLRVLNQRATLLHTVSYTLWQLCKTEDVHNDACTSNACALYNDSEWLKRTMKMKSTYPGQFGIFNASDDYVICDWSERWERKTQQFRFIGVIPKRNMRVDNAHFCRIHLKKYWKELSFITKINPSIICAPSVTLRQLSKAQGAHNNAPRLPVRSQRKEVFVERQGALAAFWLRLRSQGNQSLSACNRSTISPTSLESINFSVNICQITILKDDNLLAIPIRLKSSSIRTPNRRWFHRISSAFFKKCHSALEQTQLQKNLVDLNSIDIATNDSPEGSIDNSINSNDQLRKVNDKSTAGVNSCAIDVNNCVAVQSAPLSTLSTTVQLMSTDVVATSVATQTKQLLGEVLTEINRNINCVDRLHQWKFIRQVRYTVFSDYDKSFQFSKLVPRKNCIFVRPLLSLSRFETGKMCLFWKLPVYPDKSNQKFSFLRNRVRKQLLPTIKLFFNPQIENVLLQFAEIAVAENDYMNQIANKVLKKFIFSFYTEIQRIICTPALSGLQPEVLIDEINRLLPNPVQSAELIAKTKHALARHWVATQTLPRVHDASSLTQRGALSSLNICEIKCGGKLQNNNLVSLPLTKSTSEHLLRKIDFIQELYQSEKKVAFWFHWLHMCNQPSEGAWKKQVKNGWRVPPKIMVLMSSALSALLGDNIVVKISSESPLAKKKLNAPKVKKSIEFNAVNELTATVSHDYLHSNVELLKKSMKKSPTTGAKKSLELVEPREYMEISTQLIELIRLTHLYRKLLLIFCGRKPNTSLCALVAAMSGLQPEGLLPHPLREVLISIAKTKHALAMHKVQDALSMMHGTKTKCSLDPSESSISLGVTVHCSLLSTLAPLVSCAQPVKPKGGCPPVSLVSPAPLQPTNVQSHECNLLTLRSWSTELLTKSIDLVADKNSALLSLQSLLTLLTQQSISISLTELMSEAAEDCVIAEKRDVNLSTAVQSGKLIATTWISKERNHFHESYKFFWQGLAKELRELTGPSGESLELSTPISIFQRIPVKKNIIDELFPQKVARAKSKKTKDKFYSFMKKLCFTSMITSSIFHFATPTDEISESTCYLLRYSESQLFTRGLQRCLAEERFDVVFTHNLIIHFNKLQIETSSPFVISSLPLALQRRVAKLFLTNYLSEEIRYSQIENFLSIVKKSNS